MSEEVANGLPCRDRRDQWYLERNILASSPVTRNDIALPMFTWGLLRSKAVARPRAATLLLKTWWTGLTAVGRSREDRLVRAKRFNEREMLDILVQLNKNDGRKRKARRNRCKDGREEAQINTKFFSQTADSGRCLVIGQSGRRNCGGFAVI